jgi:hypothetical protein
MAAGDGNYGYRALAEVAQQRQSSVSFAQITADAGAALAATIVLASLPELSRP